MKKEIINVVTSFSLIFLMLVIGIFSYQKKDTISSKINEYELLVYEHDLELDQIINNRNKRELEEQLANEKREREEQEEIAKIESLRISNEQEQQAILLKQKQLAAEVARQQQIATEKAKQQQIDAAKAKQQAAAVAAATKKASRKSRAS